jgi:16S rRNA A1518/A1519 N6-dimethyltransferase RsmA/KsgA/DIM1 with predicted DNA glycosylase/AP lyase activity
MVKPGSFYPKPKVDSAIIEFIPEKEHFFPTALQKKLIQIIGRNFFWGSRKTIQNCIKKSPFWNQKNDKNLFQKIQDILLSVSRQLRDIDINNANLLNDKILLEELCKQKDEKRFIDKVNEFPFHKKEFLSLFLSEIVKKRASELRFSDWLLLSKFVESHLTKRFNQKNI